MTQSAYLAYPIFTKEYNTYSYMKLKFNIITEHKVIMQSFNGDISISSITHTLPHIWNHPDYSPSFDSIIDFRNSKLHYTKEELIHLLQTIGGAKRRPTGRVAVIVSNPTSAASATIFAENIKNNQVIGVFCSEFEVIRFLKISPEVFDKVNNLDVVTINLQ